MKKLMTAAAAASLLVLAACGSGGDSSGSSNSETTTKITVANLAVTNSAGLVLGVDKGFFTDEGLDVTIDSLPAPSTVPAAVSGKADFAFTGVPPLLNARSNKLPIQAVAPAAGYPSDLTASQIRLMAAPDAKITDVSQLEGKTIAVDTLFQLPHLSLIQALKKKDVDTSKIKFTEIPYPSMIKAVQDGTVAAADMGDPFLGQALGKGFTDLISNGEGFPPAATQVIWVASEQYIAKNPKVVAAFQRAIAKSNSYAQEHLDEVRKIVPTYMEGTDAIADKILLPEYTTKIDRGVFDTYNQLLVGLKVIDGPADVDKAIYQSK